LHNESDLPIDYQCTAIFVHKCLRLCVKVQPCVDNLFVVETVMVHSLKCLMQTQGAMVFVGMNPICFLAGYRKSRLNRVTLVLLGY